MPVDQVLPVGTFAGHFLGNHSIIDIMKREGFTVDHLRPNQKLPR